MVLDQRIGIGFNHDRHPVFGHHGIFVLKIFNGSVETRNGGVTAFLQQIFFRLFDLFSFFDGDLWYGPFQRAIHQA